MPAGTIALTNNSASVTGTGTSFNTELKVNDFIVAVVGGVTYTLGVKSIESNTALTLIQAHNGPSAAGLAWTPVPFGTMAAITSQLAAQVTYAIRGLNLDKANWQQLFTGTGNVTINLPDGTSWTGPAWNGIASSVLQKENNLSDITDKPAARSNLGVLPTSGGTMTGAISFNNVTTRSATAGNLGLNYIANDRFSILTDGNRSFLITCTTSVITTNSSGDATVTYPTAYSATPRVVACSADWAAFNGSVSTNNQTTTYFQVRCYKADGSIAANTAVRVDYVAIGRLS